VITCRVSNKRKKSESFYSTAFKDNSSRQERRRKETRKKVS